MTILTIDSIVQAVNDLPALPQVAVKVMKLIENPDSTAQDINRVLIQDQTLTGKVLKIANSAYYGFSRRIATVTDAVVLLGFSTIRSLVIASVASDMLNAGMEGYALEEGELWRHSLGSAITARRIAQRTQNYSLAEIAYIAALLHDIGKFVLNRAMLEAYNQVVHAVEEQDIPFNVAEDKVLGFNHAMVGARIAEKWNLPPELVEAIALHHNPEGAVVNKTLTAIVHMADTISMSIGLGLGGDGMLYPLSPTAVSLLDLDDTDTDKIIAEVIDLCSDMEDL